MVNGLALGFLIGFRNKHAYDRWWEARKLWGQLINENRNLCLKVRSLVGIDVGRPRCDRPSGDRVRGGPQRPPPPPRWIRRGDRSSWRKRATGITGRAGWPARWSTSSIRWQREGRIDGWGLLWLDGQVKCLMDICGACERIRNTPLSSSYRALLRHGIAIYLVIAPFYLIDDTGIYGFPMFVMAAYFLLGIELVAEEIEEPFGAGGDNLPLERYCATIATSVHDILGHAASAQRRVPTPVRCEQPGRTRVGLGPLLATTAQPVPVFRRSRVREDSRFSSDFQENGPRPPGMSPRDLSGRWALESSHVLNR